VGSGFSPDAPGAAQFAAAPAPGIALAGCRHDLSGAADLPSTSRTNVELVKSVTKENDGNEEEQIYRRTDHWVLEAGRSGHPEFDTKSHFP